MSESVKGTLNISNEVIEDIAGYAAMECYGIVGMCAPSIKDGLLKLLPKNKLRRGIAVENGESGVKVSLHVVVEEGMNISTISHNLVDAVRFALEDTAAVPVESVDVHVEEILIRK